METEIVKIVKDTTYIGKNGKEYKSCNYYVRIKENGSLIPIKPSFRNGYDMLDMLAITINE